MKVQPIVKPVKNGYHALSRDLNLAVWGATPEEAEASFKRAVATDAEIRSRPDSARFANPS